MDSASCLFQACALDEALDTFPEHCLYFYDISKVYTPSVTKQSGLKCFREGPVVPFHLTCWSFIMTALVHFLSLWHHHVEIQLFHY